MKLALEKIVSGGQSGVDRAALDAALAHKVKCGGWCPRYRRAEDGYIDIRYPLRQTPSYAYQQRTEWNVRDSDGTLVLTRGTPCGGTASTIVFAKRLGRPHYVAHLERSPRANEVISWLACNKIRVLNIAGPRDSRAPGIYQEAYCFLDKLFGSISQS